MTLVIAGTAGDAAVVCYDTVQYLRINGNNFYHRRIRAEKVMPFQNGRGFISLAGEFPGSLEKNLEIIRDTIEAEKTPVASLNRILQEYRQASNSTDMGYAEQAFMLGIYEKDGPKLFISDRVGETRLRYTEAGFIGSCFLYKEIKKMLDFDYRGMLPAEIIERFSETMENTRKMYISRLGANILHGMKIGVLTREGFFNTAEPTHKP